MGHTGELKGTAGVAIFEGLVFHEGGYGKIALHVVLGLEFEVGVRSFEVDSINHFFCQNLNIHFHLLIIHKPRIPKHKLHPHIICP